ncbi:DUF4214 domain-containing protein [Actinotalea sp. C106]|uniref:DUF4214 domain-containing protein n=1 Tax=Actinotalea sp. C106 TaxID=2908644 RepID=UPI002027D821|nr:DUF4214 domain-containing protein [Actinotalea sp. C106]
MQVHRRSGQRALVAALVLTLLGATGGPAGAAEPTATAPAPAATSQDVLAASPSNQATFVGRGWGHGRGMGQYGAYGYATVHGWGYQRILDHYYSNTTMGTASGGAIDVELMALAGKELRVMARGLRINGVTIPDATAAGTAVRVIRNQDGTYTVRTGSSCATSQPWTTRSGRPTKVTLATTSQASPDRYLRLCESTGQRFYRGTMTVQPHRTSGAQTTFNNVSVEDYLRGVVPRESPASWGSTARGMHALRAQAVAARSYALSGTRPSGAKTCDTTACQVYGGSAWQPNGGARQSLEETNTNRAVDDTRGQVRVLPGSTAPLRTEFSSSTGGWTAGGAFPAVRDDGDSVAQNPNHTWTLSVPLSTVGSALGMGTIRSLTVTARNGLGADGGRVREIVARDVNGATRTLTGDQFRSALNAVPGVTFRSDWFTVSLVSPAHAQAVVKALYQDLLGRGADPTGLRTWSNKLMSGTSQSELVSTLTRSDEYIRLRVARAYREVLLREPDPVGANNWLQRIRRGSATVDDVQRRFYDSTEYYTRAGGTRSGYVARLYQTVLDRPASAAERESWSRKWDTIGRAGVVDSIWFSFEAARIRAGAYYQTFLQRAPDPAGRDSWARVLLSRGEGAVRNGMAGSQEYRTRAIARYP